MLNKNICISIILSLLAHTVFFLLPGFTNFIDISGQRNRHGYSLLSVHVSKDYLESNIDLQLHKKTAGENNSLNYHNEVKSLEKEISFVDTNDITENDEGEVSDGFEKYISSEFIDVRPTLKREIEYDNTLAQLDEINKNVTLDVYVNENGIVTKVHVVASPVPEKYLETAISSFYGAEFYPGILNGKAVPIKMTVQVGF